MYSVIENFINEQDFDSIVDIVSNKEFPWYAYDRANNASKFGEFHFMHHLYNNGKIVSDKKFILNILANKLSEFYKKDIEIIRARVNLFTISEKNKELGFHQDIDDSKEFQVLLLYLQDSNGYTQFKNGEKINSIKNRALIFNANEEHQTVTQTDVVFRTNINFNFRIINE